MGAGEPTETSCPDLFTLLRELSLPLPKTVAKSLAPMSWGLLAAKASHGGCWAQEDRPPSGPWNLLGGHRLEPAEVEREPRQRQHAQGESC